MRDEMNIVAFPRSGNVFLNELLKLSFANPYKHKVFWHAHDLRLLKNKQVITVVRNPYDSLYSLFNELKNEETFSIPLDLVSVNKETNEPDYIYWNNRFLLETLKCKNNLTLIDFCELISNPVGVVEKIAHKFEVEANKFEIESLMKTMYSKYERHVPQTAKTVDNQLESKIKDDKFYKESLDIYASIFSL
jgi:hypothetical protein